MNEIATGTALRLRLRTLLDSHDRQAALAALLDLAVSTEAETEPEVALAAFEAVADSFATRESVQLPIWRAIAGLRLRLGLPQRALEACREAAVSAPDHPDVFFGRGVVISSMGNRGEAEKCYRDALVRQPLHLGAALNLVGLLIAEKRPQEALNLATEAVSLHENVADCWFNHGEALLSCAQTAAARSSYSRALAMQPEMTKAAIAVAFCDAALGNVAASSAFAGIAARDPNVLRKFNSPLEADSVSRYPDLESGRIALVSAYLKHRICDWSDRERFRSLFVRVLEGEGCRPLDNPDMPFLFIGLPLPHDFGLRAARQVARRLQNEARRYFPPIRPLRGHGEKIRIGYISGDFRQHATAYLVSRLPGLHDRELFEVFLYSTGPDDGSAIRREMITGADHFCDLRHFDTGTIAQRIAMDSIDILIDLSGYTLHARTESLALKPAPIQINYLAYLQTMGAPWVDYTILDRSVMLSTEREFWDERIAYLPDTLYLCDDRFGPQVFPPERSKHGLPDDRFVYCCLNAPWKIDPETFACWMEILRCQPDSVLWLYDDTGLAAANLCAEATRAGVAPKRLIFTGKMPHDEHLARYSCADLFLDTFGCNAHTTCIEALAAGLPLLTMPGDKVVSRVAASLLRAHGVPELIVKDPVAYVETACALANDPASLAALRGKVKRRDGSALFCTTRRVREIERAYRMMWARHLSGKPPMDFDVTVSDEERL